MLSCLPMRAGYVPCDAPGSSSYFTPKAARKATQLAMQNPVIAKLDVALARSSFTATPAYLHAFPFRCASADAGPEQILSWWSMTSHWKPDT